MSDLSPFQQFGFGAIAFGVVVLLLKFFVSWVKETTANAAADCKADKQALIAKVEKLEEYHRETLEPLVKESIESKRDCAAASREQSQAMKELAQAVREARVGSGGHRRVDG